MTSGADDRSSAFERGYYSRQYRPRLWRQRGDRPVLFRTLLRTLRPWRGGRLLDVGCGEGQFLRRAKRDFEAYGIDVSAEGLDRARAVSGLETVELASATSLPFSEAFFDAVTCLDVLEHLDAPEEAVCEIARVLRPGGALIISTPNPESFGHRVKGQNSFIYRDPTHVAVRPIDDWRELLRASGFRIVRDGSDAPWDSPYFRIVPGFVQWLLFAAISQLLFAFRPTYPWRLGENYVCLAVRDPVTPSLSNAAPG